MYIFLIEFHPTQIKYCLSQILPFKEKKKQREGVAIIVGLQLVLSFSSWATIHIQGPIGALFQFMTQYNFI